MQRWLIGFFGIAVLTLGIFWGLGIHPFRTSLPAVPKVAPTPGIPWFEEVAESRGIHFRWFDPATSNHLIPETMGSGLAWIDYDNDGWPDLFCVQCGPLPPALDDDAPLSRLYRNNRDGTFRDVTEEVGLKCRGFGMGCAVGDFNNDGFDDLAVTFLGGVRLLQNQAGANGARKFVDVTKQSAIENPHWATSCAWGDVDGDGLLDLYVCNYVEFDPKNPKICRNNEKGLYYQCSPSAHPLTTHRLYRNKGAGVFEDASTASGIAGAGPAPGLGVVMIDLDDDGLLDIYVANDQNPAYLFHNQGNGKFVEKALLSGCGLGPYGIRMAGMGVLAGDLDGSSLPSLFITNFQKEPNVVFLNRGNLRFDEAGTATGLGPPSLARLGFGAVLFDPNLSGLPALAVTNGHVHRTARELDGVPYAQQTQLFLADGHGKYRDVSAQAGPDFIKPRVGRGLAVADFDNDGLPDLAMSGVGEALALLRNTTSTENNWISLKIVGDGKKSNVNAVGAVVKVEAGGRTQTHFVVGGGSYLSASDYRLLIGLGESTKVDRVSVRYPSGKTQVFNDLAVRQRWQLTEGKEEAEGK